MLNRTQVFGIDDLIVIGGRNRDSRAEAFLIIRILHNMV